MKRILVGKLTLVSCVWILFSCNNEDTNPCITMQNKISQWSKDYCEEKTNGKVEEDIKSNCCTCYCLLLDQEIDPESAPTCTCMSPPEQDVQPCEGDDLQMAQDCLDDPDACKQNLIVGYLDTICYPTY